MSDKSTRRAPLGGAEILWPAGVEDRYGISSVTRWRWERSGKLPARDIEIGGRTGWKRSTIEAAEQRTGIVTPAPPPARQSGPHFETFAQ